MTIFKYTEGNDMVAIDKGIIKTKGFTLLEIITVISIMVVLSAVSVGAFFNLREKNSIQKDADSIVSIIEKAKSMSSNRKNDSAYGVKFASSSVIIFSGSAFTSGNVISKYDLERSVSISKVSLSSHSLELNFDKITGNPNATGTIILSASSHSKIVTIFGTGIIEVK